MGIDHSASRELPIGTEIPVRESQPLAVLSRVEYHLAPSALGETNLRTRVSIHFLAFSARKVIVVV